MVDDARSIARPSIGARLREFYRSPKFRGAVIVVLPSVIGFVGGQVIALSIDRQLSALRAHNNRTRTEMAVLDAATRDYEVSEWMRVSFLLDILASNGDGDTAFKLDQYHRERALRPLRDIATTLDPAGGTDRLKDYEATVTTDYRFDGNAGKARLQATETAIVGDAKKRLTQIQRLSNDERDRIDLLEARKLWWTSVLGYLGNLASVLAFFAKYNQPATES